MKRILISFILLFLLVGIACAGDLTTSKVNLGVGITETSKTLVNLTAGEVTFLDKPSQLQIGTSVLIDGVKFTPQLQKTESGDLIWGTGEKSGGIFNDPTVKFTYTYQDDKLKEVITLKEDKVLSFPLKFNVGTKIIEWGGTFKIVSTNGDESYGLIADVPYGVDAAGHKILMKYILKDNALVLDYNRHLKIYNETLTNKVNEIQYYDCYDDNGNKTTYEYLVPQYDYSEIIYPLTIDPVWGTFGTVDFTSNVTSGTAPLAVTFNGSSSSTPTAWDWYFGDENAMSWNWTKINSSAKWSSRGAFAYTKLPNGHIVLTGGRQINNTFANDTWMSANNGYTWTIMNVSSGWKIREHHSMVALPNGNLILMGGSGANGGGNELNDTWKSTDEGATWALQNASSGWKIRMEHSTVALPNGNIILVGGGSSGSSINDTWKSTDEGATWTNITTTTKPSKRISMNLFATSNSSIILFGGYDSFTYWNDTWISVDEGATWTRINSTSWYPRGTQTEGVILPNDNIVIMGGWNNPTVFHTKFLSTDLGVTWTNITTVNDTTSLSIAYDGGAVTANNGGIVVFKSSVVYSAPTNSSITQNTTHTYSSAGLYTVSLQAFDGNGYNYTIKNQYINVTNALPADPPNSSFSLNVTNGLFPLAVNFTDTSSNTPTQWNWSFGDGTWNNGTSYNVTKTYSTGGNYTVFLIASNSGGSNQAGNQYVTVFNTTVSGFTANNTIGVYPLPVGFNVTSPQDNATIWNWSFGDGIWQNGTTQNATHIYTTGGIYTVSETASNTQSTNTTTMTNYIIVYNQTTATITTNSSYIVVPPAKTVWFNGSTSVNATWYNWSFHDGTWQNGTEPNTSKLYSTGGNYTVNLTTSHNGYGANTKNIYMTVYNQTYAAFTANDTEGLFPLPVSFNVTTPNDNATYWNWSFGDGIWQNGTEQNASHIYTTGGSYQVIEYASNPYSFMASYSAAGYITVYNTTNTTFTASNTSGFIPVIVNFTDISSNATSWYWNFGDGNTSTDKSPIFTYNVLGVFNVNHSASNAYYTCWTNMTNYITVNEPSPVADFTTNATSGLFVLGIYANDTSTNNPLTWNWSFGDGTFASTKNVTHSYSSGGVFYLNLTVNNTNSTFSSKNITITVYNRTFNDFTASNVSGNVSLIVNFTETSYNATSWFWMFGDGNTSTDKDPTFIYNIAGVYSVNHSSSNGVDTNWTNKSLYITVYPPYVAASYSNFTADVLTGPQPLSVQFTSDSNNTPTAWNWSFGDGNYSNLENPLYVYNVFGLHTVTLNASNANHTYHPTTKVNYINVTDGIPPLSITNLTYNNSTCQNTTWIWDNPVADYHHLIVYKNNVWHSNITAPTEVLVWSGITAGEFSSRTCDAAGNCNSTWVNMTAPDAAVCDINPPLAPVNLTNITTCNQITWTWESQDADYYRVMVYRTDEGDPLGSYFYGLVTEPTFTSTWTGLNQSTVYNISLLSMDAAGNINYTWLNQTARTPYCTPVVDFSANETFGYVPFVVNFTDLSTGVITGWNWSFGDGNFSEDQYPTHIYEVVGLMTVTLNVSNPSGFASETKIEYINSTAIAYAPISSFIMNVSSGIPPLGVGFNDTSIFGPTSWNWSFGDGNYSNDQHPQHLYGYEGVYYVQLNATNDLGSNTSQQTLYVINTSLGGGSSSGSTSSGIMWIESNTLMSFSVVTVPAVLIMVYLLFSNRRRDDE